MIKLDYLKIDESKKCCDTCQRNLLVTKYKNKIDQLQSKISVLQKQVAILRNIRSNDPAKEILQELYNEAIQYNKSTDGILYMASKYEITIDKFKN